MDIINIVIPIIFFIGFIYLWYRVIKWILKFVKNAKNLKADSSDKFVDEQANSRLSSKFDDIVKKLEAERLVAKKKTKGLFKRSFFRTWVIMGGTALLLTITFTEGKIDPVAIIAPSIMTAFLAAIGSGIYTAIKKGMKRHEFIKSLKKELVSEIVKHVNPDLTFFDEGIAEEEFKKADLFWGKDVKSEDTIRGTIDGQNVLISECQSSTYKSSSNSSGSTTTYFNGIFVILDLANIHVSSPIKIIPSRISETNDFNKITGLRTTYRKMNINDEDKITIDSSLNKSNYEIYCANKPQANSFINATSLKILDFIFDKYETEKESLFQDVPFLKNIKLKSGVYISIVENKLFMAIDWDQDMFEPDAFLNKNLVESGIAQSIYKDLLFINQVVKEVNLLNKVNG
jgi:hypothetical protein